MKISSLILIFFLISCKSQEKPSNIEMNYQRVIYSNNSSYIKFKFNSKANYLLVSSPSASFKKEIYIKLSQVEIKNIYKDYQKFNLSKGFNCIYNDDGNIQSKAFFNFNRTDGEPIDVCLKTSQDKENFLIIEMKFLKLIKSKSEYKIAFPEEFEKL
ncbi:hypothetical protein [Halpernia sp. GG3]